MNTGMGAISMSPSVSECPLFTWNAFLSATTICPHSASAVPMLPVVVDMMPKTSRFRELAEGVVLLRPRYPRTSLRTVC